MTRCPPHLAKRRDYRQHAANEVYLTYQDVDNSAVWWLKKGDLRCASGTRGPREAAEVSCSVSNVHIVSGVWQTAAHSSKLHTTVIGGQF